MTVVTLCRAEETPQEDTSKPAVVPYFGLTQVYQQNVRGGLSTSAPEGRYAGSYDLEATVNLESLFGLENAGLFVLMEGGWPEVGGIDPVSVGSFFGVNADAIEGQWGRLSELWLERYFLDGSLLLRAGKLDLTGGFQQRGSDVSFDGSWYANDETSQFLNGALVNNPTIPFPDLTLGSAFFADLSRNCHIGAAVAARTSEGADTEFASWGSASNGLFCIIEGGYGARSATDSRPLAGDYHLGVWWETQKGSDRSRRDQRGLYVSVSQPLLAKGDGSRGGGLALFFRAGWTGGDGAALDDFWSVGLQYQGPFARSGSDVLGLGWAQGRFADSPEPDVPQGSESALELYYNNPVSDWMQVSPSLQYVVNPGGTSAGRDALIIGLRLQVLLE